MKQQRPRIKKTRKQPTKERKRRNPPQITGFWGRGASEHRPGLFTKQYLMEHGEVCAADVFHALRDNLQRLNEERLAIGDKPIRGGTYSSFATYWHWFKLAGLIELTGRQEPAAYAFLEQKQFYQLTAKGMSEEEAWQDPVRAAHPEFG